MIARPNAVLALAFPFALLLVGCATARSLPPGAAVGITANVAEATVWIDDRLAGKVADFAGPGKRLPAGFHRVEIRAAGFYSSFREVEVQPGTDVSIKADLHALLE